MYIDIYKIIIGRQGGGYMLAVKQADFRARMKEYMDRVSGGETVIIPRREGKNVAIISEEEYNELQALRRYKEYYEKVSQISNQSGQDKGILKTMEG